MKKILAIALALIMTFSISTAAFAATAEIGGQVSVNETVERREYTGVDAVNILISLWFKLLNTVTSYVNPVQDWVGTAVLLTQSSDKDNNYYIKADVVAEDLIGNDGSIQPTEIKWIVSGNDYVVTEINTDCITIYNNSEEIQIVNVVALANNGLFSRFIVVLDPVSKQIEN